MSGAGYTLQGVMKFLQLGWLSHERARNAWDIERAEMKSKIAKQEGDVRTATRLNEQLDKQIRMLESALKRERLTNQAMKTGENLSVDEFSNADPKGKPGLNPDIKDGMKADRWPGKQHNSFFEFESESHDATEQEKDSQCDKSKLYLKKCVEEVTYLLTPPANPPPHGNLSSVGQSVFSNGREPPMSLEEVYLQQRQISQQQLDVSSHQSSMSSHPPIPSLSDVPNLTHTSRAPHQSHFMNSEISSQQPMPNFGSSSHQPHGSNASGFPALASEQSEKVAQLFDTFSRSTVSEDEIAPTPSFRPHESERWNFDDNPPLPDPPVEGQIHFPINNILAPDLSPPRTTIQSHRRRLSNSTVSGLRSEGHEIRDLSSSQNSRSEPQNFRVRFALRGHLDVIRSVIFTGGGSPSEPEICSAGDDGVIKRWIIPASYANMGPHGLASDLDIQSYFTHRGHEGAVTSLAACPASANFSTGGRVLGDGWIFSGGQDSTVRVWERGRVDPKATLEGHSDTVWAVCVLPATSGSVFGANSANFGGPDRILLASGSADGTIKIWAVSAPPQIASPPTGSRRGIGGRRLSVTSGSNYPSSPQPNVATPIPFNYTLVQSIERPSSLSPSPTCICPLSMSGESFVVSFSDASIIIFDIRTGEEIPMASTETYDGTPATGVNTVVATSVDMERSLTMEPGRGMPDDSNVVHGATGSASGSGNEGVIISGHEDKFIRFFDANSGQCTYSMLAHPSSISSLSLSNDGREAVSAGHDASIRFWSLEKRICTQELTCHRIMRGEGVCTVVWSHDGRLVVSAGGDGVVKVFTR